MSEHMSAKDYQRLIVNKEKDDGAMSDEDFHKALHGIDKVAGEKVSNITFGEAKIVNKKVAKKMEQVARARDKFINQVGAEFIDEVIVDTTGPVKIKTSAKNGDVVAMRYGYGIYQGGKKVKEVNGPWQPLKKPKKKQVNDSPLEDDVTEQVAQYLDLLMAQSKVLEYSHIPQETFTRSWGTKMKNKRMGVRSGVPDMLIIYPRGILFLELKREKGGVLSESQKHWIEVINSIDAGGDGVCSDGPSICAEVARGFGEAKKKIDLYI